MGFQKGFCMMQKATTLGMQERTERVLSYLFFWVSGLFFFMLEKNRNVRWHAAQSMLTFGSLFVLMFAVSLLQGTLSIIPLIGWVFAFGLGLLYQVLFWITILLWLWLMAMAFVRSDYKLPIVGDWVRLFV
jgi:uncharacterized membrane protein